MAGLAFKSMTITEEVIPGSEAEVILGLLRITFKHVGCAPLLLEVSDGLEEARFT